MRVSKATALLTAGASMLVLGAIESPTAARIQCQGTGQVVDGALISTPFCEDNYIAEVARTSYGMRVTAAQVRNNPSIKADVCRAIGHDIRIAHLCFVGSEEHTLGGGQQISDARLKRGIRHLATLANGTKLYAFRYLWSNVTHVGVMAQDLLNDPVRRSAVKLMRNGFYAVDYDALGLRMTTLEEWQERGTVAVIHN